MSLRKSAIIGVSAIALSLGLAYSAQADVVLPVTNLTFNEFTGTFTQPKDFFTHAEPTGWSIGAAAQDQQPHLCRSARLRGLFQSVAWQYLRCL